MPRGVTTTRQASELEPISDLADVIQAAVGQPVSVMMSVAADGTAILDVLHPNQDIPISITANQLRTLVTNFVKPAPRVDPLDALADALAGGSTVAEIRAAFLAWVNSERAFQRRGRDYPQPSRLR